MKLFMLTIFAITLIAQNVLGQEHESLVYMKPETMESSLIIIRLLQAFNSSKEFVHRGLITMNSQQPMFKQEPLNIEQLAALEQAVLEGENYYLMAQAFRTLDINHEKPYQVSTVFLRSCALYESSLNDQLVINLDANGKFVSVSANVPGYYCTQSSNIIGSLTAPSNFNTTLKVMKSFIAPG